MASVICRQSLWTRLATMIPQLEAMAFRPRQSAEITSTVSSPLAPVTKWLEKLVAPKARERVSDLWDTVLMAVPKKKTTHTQKLKRMTGKHLRKTNMMMRCEVCQSWKRSHFYCAPKCPGRREMGV